MAGSVTEGKLKSKCSLFVLNQFSSQTKQNDVVFQNICTVVSDGLGSHRWRRCQLSAGCCLCAAGFPLALHFGRRSMAVWMCADMLTVLLHQLFGKGEVKATPASCFQRDLLCVYPQATIKASREPRFNHMHHSCPTETHCSKCTCIRNHAQSYTA